MPIFIDSFEWFLHFSSNCIESRKAGWRKRCNTVSKSKGWYHRSGILKRESTFIEQKPIFDFELEDSSHFIRSNWQVILFCSRTEGKIYLFLVYLSAFLALHTWWERKLIFTQCKCKFCHDSWKKDTSFLVLSIVCFPSQLLLSLPMCLHHEWGNGLLLTNGKY